MENVAVSGERKETKDEENPMKLISIGNELRGVIIK